MLGIWIWVSAFFLGFKTYALELDLGLGLSGLWALSPLFVFLPFPSGLMLFLNRMCFCFFRKSILLTLYVGCDKN
jgi:hypothetical protein